ncbi:uncharacterized protein GJ701_005811 [Geothlypis trichas]
MAVPWQGFSPLVSAGWRGRELRGANADMSQCAVPARRGTEPSVPRRHSHFTNPLYQSDAQPGGSAAEPGNAELPGTAWPSAPGRGEGAGGAARQRPAPGTRSLQRPRGGLRRRCRPASPAEAARAPGASSGRSWGAAERGAGTGAGGSRKQVGAGALVPACPLRPPAPVPASGRPSRPASAAGCRSLPRRSYTARGWENRQRAPSPKCLSRCAASRHPLSVPGSGPVSGAAGSPPEPVHDKFHRAPALNVGKPHGERKDPVWPSEHLWWSTKMINHSTLNTHMALQGAEDLKQSWHAFSFCKQPSDTRCQLMLSGI